MCAAVHGTNDGSATPKQRKQLNILFSFQQHKVYRVLQDKLLNIFKCTVTTTIITTNTLAMQCLNARCHFRTCQLCNWIELNSQYIHVSVINTLAIPECVIDLSYICSFDANTFKISSIHIWLYWFCFKETTIGQFRYIQNSFIFFFKKKNTSSSNMTFCKVFSNLQFASSFAERGVQCLPLLSFSLPFTFKLTFVSFPLSVCVYFCLFRYFDETTTNSNTLNKSLNFYMSCYSMMVYPVSTLNRSQFDFSTFHLYRYHKIHFEHILMLHLDLLTVLFIQLHFLREREKNSYVWNVLQKCHHEK